jgi:hypothetical protein
MGDTTASLCAACGALDCYCIADAVLMDLERSAVRHIHHCPRCAAEYVCKHFACPEPVDYVVRAICERCLWRDAEPTR